MSSPSSMLMMQATASAFRMTCPPNRVSSAMEPERSQRMMNAVRCSRVIFALYIVCCWFVACLPCRTGRVLSVSCRTVSGMLLFFRRLLLPVPLATPDTAFTGFLLRRLPGYPSGRCRRVTLPDCPGGRYSSTGLPV